MAAEKVNTSDVLDRKIASFDLAVLFACEHYCLVRTTQPELIGNIGDAIRIVDKEFDSRQFVLPNTQLRHCVENLSGYLAKSDIDTPCLAKLVTMFRNRMECPRIIKRRFDAGDLWNVTQKDLDKCTDDELILHGFYFNSGGQRRIYYLHG